MIRQFVCVLLGILLSCNINSQNNDLVQIRPFGTNPGNLKLMFYDPNNITEKAPLVVVLHGCTQTAKSCAEQTGWNKLAKKHQFYVLYPEQIILNNAENCFNWYKDADQTREKGEPASIMQMIQFLKATKFIDSTRIYITGLSAGGAMTSIMLSVFPEVFDKGAVFGGGPYKSAESVLKAGPAMLGMVSKSPEDWGKLVKDQNPGFKGNYPELAVFHGSLDPVVSINNANQLIKQWVNIHSSDYEADEHFERFQNNEDVELSIYRNDQHKDIVYYYRIRNMGHALPVDTGFCDTQGGSTGLFSVDKNFHSTFWAAQFFGIIKQPYQIEGPSNVKTNAVNLTYSVPYHDGSTYQWHTPAGVWITNGKNTHAITVTTDWQSGYIEAVETDKNGCKMEPSQLWINIE